MAGSGKSFFLEAAVRLLVLGWYVSIILVGGVFLGVWLDNKTGFSPLFTLLGLFFGLIVALIGAYRMTKPLLSRNINKVDKY